MPVTRIDFPMDELTRPQSQSEEEIQQKLAQERARLGSMMGLDSGPVRHRLGFAVVRLNVLAMKPQHAIGKGWPVGIWFLLGRNSPKRARQQTQNKRPRSEEHTS